MKKINILAKRALSLILLYFCAAILIASPVQPLQQASDQLISTLKQNKAKLKTNPAIIHEAVKRYFLPHVDLTGMSRSVLGRAAWRKASVKERQGFIEAFTKLVIRTYSTPLADYNGETIKFLPVKTSQNKRFLRVKSIVIRPNGKNVALNYSLVAKNNSWQIYDLNIEGVSLLQSFRNQFAQMLNNKSIASIIKQMNSANRAA